MSSLDRARSGITREKDKTMKPHIQYRNNPPMSLIGGIGRPGWTVRVEGGIWWFATFNSACAFARRQVWT